MLRRTACILVAVVPLVACKGKSTRAGDGSGLVDSAAGTGSFGSAGSDAVAGSAAGSGSGAGSGSDSGSGGAGRDAKAYAGELPESQNPVKGETWSIKVGFHDHADTAPENVDQLTVEIADVTGKPAFRISGFAALAGKGIEPPKACDNLSVMAMAEDWGEVSGVRIALVCTNGEDFKTAAETAILLDIRGPSRDQVATLWAGEADVYSNEMDACLRSTRVTFKVKGTTMTKTIVDETERSDEAPADCKKRKKQTTEDVTITRAP